MKQHGAMRGDVVGGALVLRCSAAPLLPGSRAPGLRCSGTPEPRNPEAPHDQSICDGDPSPARLRQCTEVSSFPDAKFQTALTESSKKEGRNREWGQGQGAGSIRALPVLFVVALCKAKQARSAVQSQLCKSYPG